MLKNNVEQLLYSAGITRYELAKKCGFVTDKNRVLYTAIDNAIGGKSITVENALKVFYALKAQSVCDNFEEVFYLSESAIFSDSSDV